VLVEAGRYRGVHKHPAILPHDLSIGSIPDIPDQNAFAAVPCTPA